MKNMKHTPEPWEAYYGCVIAESEQGITINGGTGKEAREYYGGNLIGESISDANADRIVACVNACAGMEDPAAEIAALRAEVERLKPAAKPSLPDRFFVPCTEQEADEVYELLEGAGYKTEGLLCPKMWTEICTGVEVYDDRTFQSFYNNANYPEISIDELKNILR